MSVLDEVSQLLSGQRRAIVISQRDLDLKNLGGENTFFVLRMVEGSSAAGGRGGGYGERSVDLVAAFRYVDGKVEKVYQTETSDDVSRFEIPYYVARLPLTLPDGTESMGYGVVEPELVVKFLALTKKGVPP